MQSRTSGDEQPVGLVALDMAGTTVDEHDIVYTVLRAVTEEAGARYDEETFARHTGTEKRSAIDALLREGGVDVTEGTVDDVHRTFLEQLGRRYREAPPLPLPGAEQMFRALRSAGLRVALTTGYDRRITDTILEALNWSVGPAGTVDLSVCATEVASGRPAPDMLLHAIDALGIVDAATVWAVGDTAADMRAARAARVSAVGVLTGYGDADELREAGADAVVSSVAELDRAPGLDAVLRSAGAPRSALP